MQVAGGFVQPIKGVVTPKKLSKCMKNLQNPEPVGRCLIGKGLRYLELVDKKELSRALKEWSIDYSIQGPEPIQGPEQVKYLC